MDPWLVIVAQLPTEDPSARMRELRKLESLGAGVLREGAYALPDPPANRKSLDELAAVYAFARAMSGVCGPAKRSRSSTCSTPMRSTTATVAWKPLSRHFLSAACAAFSAVSGVSTRTVKVDCAAATGIERTSAATATEAAGLTFFS